MDKEIKYCKVIGVGPCLVGSDDRIICKVSEVPAMQKQISDLEHKVAWFEKFACKSCGGAGSVGTPPDDYYDCPDCVQPFNKMELDFKLLREAVIAAKDLVNLVEGAAQKRFTDESGVRLKDTMQWARFYVSTKEALEVTGKVIK